MEFKQRQQIMDLLWNDLEIRYSPGTKAYIKQRKLIEQISSFKLNKTPTFYYLAYKYTLRHEDGSPNRGQKLGNFLWSTFVREAKLFFAIPWKVSGGEGEKGKWKFLHSFLYEDSKRLGQEATKSLLDDEYAQKGIDLFYVNKEAEVLYADNEPPRMVVKEGSDNTKTSKYQHVKDYINSRNDISSDKKSKIINQFDAYVDKLLQFPKGEAVIKREVYILLHEDFGNNLDFSIKLQKIIDRKTSKIPLFSTLKARIPRVKLQRYIRFHRLIKRGEWLGSNDEFKVEIDKIESTSTYNVKANYDTKIGGKNFDSEMERVFSEGKKIGNISRLILDDFINSNKLGENLEFSKEARTPLLNNIFEYIEYGIRDNKVEKVAKREITELFNKFIAGDILFANEGKFYSEIDKILQGYLPSYKVVNNLNEVIKANETHPDIDKLRALLDKAEKGELQLKSEDISILKRNISDFDFTIDRSYIHKTTVKATITSKIEQYKGWSTADYNITLTSDENANKIEFKRALESRYFHELNSLLVIDTIEGNTGVSSKRQVVIQGLDSFAEALSENKYSNGQANEILERIFAGEDFKSIPINNKKDTSVIYDGKRALSMKVKSLWDTLDNDAKIRLAGDLNADPNIDNSLLHPEIESSLKNLEGAKDIIIQTNELNRMITDLSEVSNLNDLNILKTEFNTYIKEQKINRNADEFKAIIGKFNKLYNEIKGTLVTIPKSETLSRSASEIERVVDGQELSAEERTKLRMELYDFIDGLKRIARLNNDEESLQFLNRAKRRIRSLIDSGDFTKFEDILHMDITIKDTGEILRLNTKALFSDERFDSIPEIKFLRGNENIGSFNIRNIWKHLKLKI